MLTVGLVCDLLEEKWLSMDGIAEQLGRTLSLQDGIRVSLLRPGMKTRITRVPVLRRHPRAEIADRLWSRYRDYPRWLAAQQACDVYHVVDHSYAHLANVLPPERTVVTCHDTDAFTALRPGARASALRRGLARRTLSGLTRAARIVCGSDAVRRELLQVTAIEWPRTHVLPYGVHPAFLDPPSRAGECEAARLLSRAGRGPLFLNVGSAIPRKRLDVLLRAFAKIRQTAPNARLVRVGPMPHALERLAHSLGVTDAMLVLPFVETSTLAALYRRASAVLVTSEAEGFGLPVIEALACGTPVVASDLAALRESGGEVARYCGAGDADAFARTALLAHEERARGRGARRAHALRFSWDAHAASLASLYRELV